MTSIRKVRALYFASNVQQGNKYIPFFFEVGLRSDGFYYFRNQLIEIPNEFETCPNIYPRMFFARITSFLDGIDWNVENRQNPLWHFYIEYADGVEKTLSTTNLLEDLQVYLRYSNLLAFTVGNWSSKKIRPASSYTLTLDDLRAEVKLGAVSLERFLRHRIDLLFRDQPYGLSENCVIEKADGSIEIPLQKNPYSDVDPTSIIIKSDGTIENDGDILYAMILREKKVKVIKNAAKQYEGPRFPAPDEKTRKELLDPNYLLNENTTEYSFANKEEYTIFCRRFQSSGKVVWNTSAAYIVEYNAAFQEYEDERYENALRLYFKALKINPIAIDARFEIANCYVKLGEFTNALLSLAVLKDFLFTEQYIAKFYRTLGYIYSENESKDYHLSYCCYKHSNKYDRVGLYKAEVDREMIYLTSKEGEGRFRSDAKYWASYEPEEVLGWYNIPVLKANDRVVKS